VNEISIFEFENQQVETITLNDEILFNPFDVANILGIKEESLKPYLSKMDDSERFDLDSLTSKERIILKIMDNVPRFWVKEPGLYTLIFKSRKPDAQRFVKWVTHDVLPEIRKNGSYGVEIQNNRLIQNLMDTTEQLLGIKREELAILQGETPNKRLSNLMIDCSRNGMGSMPELYAELFYLFDAEIGIDINEIAKTKNLERKTYLKNNKELCETVYKFAYNHFTRSDRQIMLVPWDNNQRSLSEYGMN
jgi:prophage antirepressor-like protein